MKAALLLSGSPVVENVIRCAEAYSLPGYDVVALPEDSRVVAGWLYDRTTGDFAEPALAASREVAPIDFQRLFTPTEYCAALELAEARPATLMTWIWGLFDKAVVVRMDNPDTAAGIAYMQHVAGILTAERAAQILEGVAP